MYYDLDNRFADKLMVILEFLISVGNFPPYENRLMALNRLDRTVEYQRCVRNLEATWNIRFRQSAFFFHFGISANRGGPIIAWFNSSKHSSTHLNCLWNIYAVSCRLKVELITPASSQTHRKKKNHTTQWEGVFQYVGTNRECQNGIRYLWRFRILANNNKKTHTVVCVACGKCLPISLLSFRTQLKRCNACAERFVIMAFTWEHRVRTSLPSLGSAEPYCHLHLYIFIFILRFCGKSARSQRQKHASLLFVCNVWGCFVRQTHFDNCPIWICMGKVKTHALSMRYFVR